MERMPIVIVGHIDHGKSTLIGRLLFDTDSLLPDKINEIKNVCESLGKDIEFGYVLDYLEEERGQGITIDTTQVFFNTPKREYAIIDAPGHVEFVKNMITGASQADSAVLIIDAEEGVKEQTRRHSYILGMLGLKQVIVVMNKMDLVGYSKERYEEVKNELIKFLDTINIKPTYIIPISAKNGDFVAKKSEKLFWFDGPTVLEALDTFDKKKDSDDKQLRFPIQDVYKWDKRIFAGRISSGVMKENDEIMILPTKEITTIKSIEKYGQEPKQAFSGENIGITTTDKVFADRGNIIVHKDASPMITDTFKAHVFWMDPRPLKEGERLKFKCATQEVMCSVEIKRLIDSSTLEVLSEDATEMSNRQVADVIIKTEKPVVIDNFNNTEELGRFVLMNEDDTSAGGIISEV